MAYGLFAFAAALFRAAAAFAATGFFFFAHVNSPYEYVFNEDEATATCLDSPSLFLTRPTRLLYPSGRDAYSNPCPM